MSGNVVDILRRNAELNKRIYETNRQISYVEMWNKINALKEKILNCNRLIQNNVGVYLPNGIDYVIALFSIQAASKIPVPMSLIEKPINVIDMILYTRQNLIITDDENYSILYPLLVESQYQFILYNITTDLFSIINNENEVLIDDYPLNPSEVAIILKTSGTTDNPKFAMLTHEGIIFNVKAHIRSLNISSAERTLIQLPMCFGYCYSSQLLVHIFLGAEIFIGSQMFNLKQFIRQIKAWQITNTTIVPSVLQVLNCTLKNIEQFKDFSSLKYLCFGGAKADINLIDQLNRKLKFTYLVQTYGLTEHSPRISTKIYDKRKKLKNSVGFPLDGVEISIRTSNGEKALKHTPGVIWVKSPSVMKGYYKNQNETEKILKNGWLNTGDIGYIDLDNELCICGRQKNIIIFNGININPEEIEVIILNTPGVEKVLVSKEEHEVFGEVPVATISVKKEYDPNVVRDCVIKNCKRTLPNHKWPRKVTITNYIETTITGKVKRK